MKEYLNKEIHFERLTGCQNKQSRPGFQENHVPFKNFGVNAVVLCNFHFKISLLCHAILPMKCV